MSEIRKVSVVIPAYNEEATIEQIIAKVRAADVCGLELEIVVVDDGSKDRTRAILEKMPGIKYIAHERNRGKGGAVKTGFATASGQIVMIQDADLEYDPKDYPALIKPILNGADAVMGSRFAYERPTFFSGPNRSPFFSHYIGNILITGLTNLLYANAATDYYACYKAFRKSVIDSIAIESDGFQYDNELLCKLLRRGVKIVEVPVVYRPRSYKDGKKINWTDGVAIIWTIVKWRFKGF